MYKETLKKNGFDDNITHNLLTERSNEERNNILLQTRKPILVKPF